MIWARFAAVLGAAANISGASDSTAAVAGAALGVEDIRAVWVEQVENREMLLDLADHQGGPGFGAG